VAHSVLTEYGEPFIDEMHDSFHDLLRKWIFYCVDVVLKVFHLAQLQD
jgi:hypothetical protein